MSVTAVCVLYLLHNYVVNRTDFLHLDFFAEVIYPPAKYCTPISLFVYRCFKVKNEEILRRARV